MKRVVQSLIRSITACAGETGGEHAMRTRHGVYHRVCGGNSYRLKYSCNFSGLSPRVRGKPPFIKCYIILKGSITACAGETKGLRVAVCVGQVYHRVCGGNFSTIISCPQHEGLSPRVRGKPLRPSPRVQMQGSITACAGETLKKVLFYLTHGVYHRVCGGNALYLSCDLYVKGLSPRVRGKL